MKSKTILIISISITVAVLGLVASVLLSNQPASTPNVVTNTTQENPVPVPVSDLKKFNSTNDLQKFLMDSQARSLQYNYPMHGAMEPLGSFNLGRPETAMPAPSGPTPAINAAPASSGGQLQYSSTNVQVEGVDEPDFLKNDDKYAYILSQDKLTIIDAYPGSTAKIISKIGLDIKDDYLQNLFLNKDRLVIFYNDNEQRYSIPQYDYIPNSVYTPVTHAVIIDVSDKENPKILKNYEVTGSYTGARMIGDYVYFISTSYVDYIHPMPPILQNSQGVSITPDVYYFGNPETDYNFDTITAFDMFSDQIDSKTFMLGSTGTLYVSSDAIYLTYQKYQPYYNDETYDKDRFFTVIVPLLPSDVQSQINSTESSNIDPSQKWAKISDLLQNSYNKMSEDDRNALFEKIQQAISEYDIKVQQDYRNTVIQKFSINNGTVSYVAQGKVAGYLLNQYSMDEYKDKLRVATTTEYFTSNGTTATSNNIYVLDGSLNVVGSLQGVAPEESIQSARFIGDKLYLVTYQRIDPFFVIDLSTDMPKVLGTLKIPGYSRYLHPYDDTHIIGIGKETKQDQYGNLEPMGVKIALYDVSDVSNPITVDTYLIGGQGTDSEILSDPKAFLFDKEKNLLSIPISFQSYGQPIPLSSREIPGGTVTGGGPTEIIPSQSMGGSAGVMSSPPSTGEPTGIMPSSPVTSGSAGVMPLPPSAAGGGSAAMLGDGSTTGEPAVIMPYPPIMSSTWKGFYIFGVDLAKGFSLRGIVEHYNGTNDGGYGYGYGYGSRSFYINDSLYTVTPSLMKINDLNDIKHEINSIKLDDTGQIVKYPN